jgi:hypothetical protein
MTGGLPTPRTTLRTGYVCVHVWCKAATTPPGPIEVKDAVLLERIYERPNEPMSGMRCGSTRCLSGAWLSFSTRWFFLAPSVQRLLTGCWPTLC